MFTTIKIIYNRLYLGNPRTSVSALDSNQIIRFLQEKLKIDQGNTIYPDLIEKIKNLRQKEIPLSFIERYCLAVVSDHVLSSYAVNVAEAYIIAYVILNEPVEINDLYFKVGNSGLLGPTIINGQKINDIEAIAQFLIKSLDNADLICLTEDKVYLGATCQLES